MRPQGHIRFCGIASPRRGWASGDKLGVEAQTLVEIHHWEGSWRYLQVLDIDIDDIDTGDSIDNLDYKG